MAKLIEIKGGVINTNTLKLEGDKHVTATALTFDGQKVKYTGRVFLSDLDLPPADLSEKISTLQTRADAHLLVDRNAVVEGGPLWRRGKSTDVCITTSDDLDRHCQQNAITISPDDTHNQKQIFKIHRPLGVWEVVE